MKVFDVAVIGGGPSGATAAYVLACAGKSVVLIDRPPTKRRKIGESLPAAARPLLRDLGLLAILDHKAHLPAYGNASAWGSDELITMDFVRDPHGNGWHLHRNIFDAALRDAAQSAGATFIIDNYKSAKRHQDEWQVNLASQIVRARWLIDATGRSAQLARRHGAKRYNEDRLSAWYAWASSSAADQDCRTVVEATRNGWWYSALVPGNKRMVSFHTREVQPSMATWKNLLSETKHLKCLLAEAKLSEELHHADASSGRLDVFCGTHWLATGDAALAFDPLSSQGIFNALYGGMKAGEAVEATLQGDCTALAKYVQRLDTIRAAYLEKRQFIYRSESRWQSETFWSVI